MVPATFPTIPPIVPNVCRNPIVPPSNDLLDGDDAVGKLTIRLRFDFRLGSRKQSADCNTMAENARHPSWF